MTSESNAKSEKKEVYVVCNAGKERSRTLASALDAHYRSSGENVSVIARGSYGLGEDDRRNSLSTKYGWVPPQGLIDVMAEGGVDFHDYESAILTEDEAERASKIIVVDPLIASRVKGAYPKHAGKVVNALEVLADEDHPFPKYLGGDSIPDAYCGHLGGGIRAAIHSTDDPHERLRRVSEVLGRELADNEVEFVNNYDLGNPVNPNAVMEIPEGLRDYVGHGLDSKEAYLAEAEILSSVASKLLERGHLD